MQQGDGWASEVAVVVTVPLLGVSTPRIYWAPEGSDEVGLQAVELAREFGLVLDPWQELVLVDSMRRRSDGKWAAFEVGVVAARQNGKDGILEARSLAGLFLDELDERLIVHSAHLADTSREAHRRLVELLEGSEEYSRLVGHVWRTNGHEAIELLNGKRIRFRTRTGSGGRGLSGDVVFFNEAMILTEASHGAVMPIVSAKSVEGNPQIWYAGSAVDQMIHEHGVVLARIRERGIAGKDPSLAYFEYSAEVEGDQPLLVASRDTDLLESEEAWAQANPALGIRISPEHIANELRSMDQRTFAVERLGVGDWPATDGSARTVIPVKKWLELVDAGSEVLDPVAFAYDVSPDGSSSSIAVAGRRADGLFHVEVVESRDGTKWVAPRLAELVAAHDAVAVLCDSVSPAGGLIPEVEELGVEVVAVTAHDHARACGQILGAVNEATLRHLGTRELLAAVRGAARRPLSDAWAWSRKNSAINISPLVAVTLALWGASTIKPKRKPKPGFAFV